MPGPGHPPPWCAPRARDRRARRSPSPCSPASRSWLNPHVYLDTVFLLGSVANTPRFRRSLGRSPPARASRASSGSSASAYGARLLGQGCSRATATWRILDAIIAVVMVTLRRACSCCRTESGLRTRRPSVLAFRHRRAPTPVAAVAARRRLPDDPRARSPPRRRPQLRVHTASDAYRAQLRRHPLEAFVSRSDARESTSKDAGAASSSAHHPAPRKDHHMSGIPVLDLSLLNGLRAAGALSRRPAGATHEVGFFSLVGHGVPAELIERAMPPRAPSSPCPSRTSSRSRT